MGHVRAKIRCLKKTQTWDLITSFQFRPTYAHNGEGGVEENRRYWKATPSGEMELNYQTLQAPSIDAGTFFYLEMRLNQSNERPWRVRSVEHQYEGSTLICLMPEWNVEAALRSGTLRLAIDNLEAALQFRPGDLWSLDLIPVDVPSSGA